jgi:hypothetical protein
VIVNSFIVQFESHAQRVARGPLLIGASRKVLQSLAIAMEIAHMESSIAPFDATGWKALCDTLCLASAATSWGAEPFWAGVELTYPGISLGYTGVLCAENTGGPLSASELENHTRAAATIRKQWPSDYQLRFFTRMDELHRAARRSLVFGAVVDAESPAAVALAESLANEITIDNAQTALRVLSVISPPLTLRGAGPIRSLQLPPAAFDVLLYSKTNEPWFEHRDLAVMCAAQRVGIIGVDFHDICRVCKRYVHSSWVSKFPKPVGAKASGGASGSNRASIATRNTLRGIAKYLPVSQVSDAIVSVSSARRLLRLKELKTVVELVRDACPNLDELVLIDNFRDQGEYLSVDIIAVTGGDCLKSLISSTDCADSS